MTSPFIFASVIFNFGVATSLGAAVHFWVGARQVSLPDASLDVRPTLGALRDLARRIDARARLNARAALCVAFAAFCQGGSTAAFLLFRAGF